MNVRRALAVGLAVSLVACRKDPGAGVAVVTPPETPSVPTAADAPAEKVPPPDPETPNPEAESPSATFTTTAADAEPFCMEIVGDEENPIFSCRFIAGQALAGGGRIDVLEVVYDDTEQAETREAHVVLRLDESPHTKRIGEAFDWPGYSEDYTLGTLEVIGSKATVRAELVTTTFPNTGNPDVDPQIEIVERATVVVTCSLDPDVGRCERDVEELP